MSNTYKGFTKIRILQSNNKTGNVSGVTLPPEIVRIPETKDCYYKVIYNFDKNIIVLKSGALPNLI